MPKNEFEILNCWEDLSDEPPTTELANPTTICRFAAVLYAVTPIGTYPNPVVVNSTLLSKFQFGKEYSEKEVNNIIEAHHSFNNIALLRRELVSKRLLKRKDDGSKYWKTKTPPIRPNQSL